MASAAARRMSLLRNAKTTLQLLKSPIFNRSGKTDIKPLSVSVTKSRGGLSSLFNTDDNTSVDKSERVVIGDAVLFWKTGFLNHSDVMEAARGRKPAVDSDSDMTDYDGDYDVVDDDDFVDDDDDDDDESEQLGRRP